MIVAPTWIWLHFPKCAGSAAEKILRDIYGSDPTVRFDAVGPGKPVIWHQSIKQRMASDPAFDPSGRRVVANIRRLPNWILSRVHFEVQRSGLNGSVSRNALVQGRFRNRKTPGNSKQMRLVSADEQLAQFAPAVTDWVRSEEMIPDLARVLGFDSTKVAERRERVNAGQIEYIRDLSFWFTPRELDRLYQSNPVWAELERKVYGDLVSLG